MSTYQILTQTLQKIKRSEERLKILIENKASLEAKVREKKVALDKENYDVEKLEGLSIEGFIHLIKGTLIDKLDKEEREAMIAKNQYEIACQELEVCLKEITLYRERIKDKFIVERDYLEFIKAQEAKMLNMNSADAIQVKSLMDAVYYNTEIIREIKEAIEAGIALKKAFDCIVESLEKADDLGIIDILENGLLVSDCGHEDVKNTNKQLVLIQQHIRRYHIEVLDVLGICDVSIDNSRLLMFSDCFIERVMTGEKVSEKIVSAMDLIKEMLRHMEESIALLKEKEEIIQIENNGLTNNKIQLIESYLNQIGGVDEESS
ncbi:MAG: hypothetical protein JEZ08_22740 [Clostridiales bacterium]|nr:hypothetical protein [Clostridiales bacterium]